MSSQQHIVEITLFSTSVGNASLYNLVLSVCFRHEKSKERRLMNKNSFPFQSDLDLFTFPLNRYRPPGSKNAGNGNNYFIKTIMNDCRFKRLQRHVV